MSTRFQAGALLDFSAPAYNVISGNASGTTPQQSGWIKVKGVETIALALTTASSTSAVWTFEVADGPAGQNSIPLPNPPTTPTSVNQSTTVTVTIPEIFKYLRVTATPTAGSGAITATPGLVQGRGVLIHRLRSVGVVIDCPASATLAGQASIDYSADYNPGPSLGLGDLDINTPSDPAVWFPATDSSNTAITIAAKTASTIQKTALRLGSVEFTAIRAAFTPSAGFGRYRITYSAKA